METKDEKGSQEHCSDTMTSNREHGNQQEFHEENSEHREGEETSEGVREKNAMH